VYVACWNKKTIPLLLENSDGQKNPESMRVTAEKVFKYSCSTYDNHHTNRVVVNSAFNLT
jgi:hypothetical protein